jgi:Flp pilus assembly protein TadG
MFTRITALAREIRESREGAVAIQMGLIFAALLGTGALASEIGFVTYKHRQMQSAADAAAFGAAVALSKSSSANFTLVAKGLAASVSCVGCSPAPFVDGAYGVTVAVNDPPATGTYAGQAGYVEVIITQPQTLYIVGAVNSLTGSANPSGLFNLGVQAVAGTGLANICMLALGTTGAAFKLNGSVTVGNSNCGIADNSASNPSTDIKGGSATIYGQFSSNGPQNTSGNNANFKTPPKTGVTTTDPYIANGENAWVLAQATSPLKPASNCTSPNLSSGSATVQTYCNVTGGTLSNNVYYVNSISGSVTVTNATVVVYGSASFGNSTVKITAPTSTSAKGESGLGLVSPNAIAVSFVGNGSLQLAGAIYLPNQGSQASLAGTVNVPCAQVIAGTISLSGNDQFGNDGTCGLANITTPGSVKLVQ